MSACRAERRAPLIAALAIILAVGAGPAFAQGQTQPPRPGPPIRLGPPVTQPPATRAPSAIESQPLPGSDTQIELRSNAARDGDGEGLTEDSRGGLGRDLWSGLTRTELERLLPRLPAPQESRAAHDIARRLLVARADPPRPDGAAGRSLLALRVERLMELGETQAAQALLRRAGAQDRDPALAAARRDLALLGGRIDEACAVTREQVERAEDADWDRAVIFCQAVAKDFDRANLGLTLRREQSGAEDPVLDRAVAALEGDKVEAVDSAANATPLTLAMLRTMKQPLPIDIAQSKDPGVLAAVARDAGVEIVTRLAAAEQAEAYGALPTPELARLYDGLTLTPEELRVGDPQTVVGTHGPRAWAILYRAAKAEEAPAARVRLLSGAWRAAADRNVYPTIARVTAPLAMMVQRRAELAGYAGDMARALLVAGRGEAAHDWLGLAAMEGARLPAAKTEAVRLWPLLRLAGAEAWAPDEPLQPRLWIQGEQARDPAGFGRRAAVLAALFAALGEDSAPRIAAVAPGAGARSLAPAGIDPALWNGLLRAETNVHVGSALLHALIVLGPGDLDAADPVAIGQVVEAIRAVGLGAEARALAVEAALAAGL